MIESKKVEVMKERYDQEISEDFPLSAVPEDHRKGFWSVSIVLLGFVFFTSTMWAGGRIGLSFKLWPDLVLITVLGNLLLGSYVAVLGYIAQRTGMSTVLLGRYAFGDWGSRWPDLVLGLTQVGWYAWGVAMVSSVFTDLLRIPSDWRIPMMIFFGFAFSWTAYVGYRGLELLSIFSVPLMAGLVAMSLAVATRDAGGVSRVLSIEPPSEMSVPAALTLIFGTFVSGGTQATNWTRFSKRSRDAVLSSLLAFFLGNGLMVFTGAYGALVYSEPDLVNILVKQGLLFWGVVMLFLSTWTTQDSTIYNFSLAGCDFFRSDRRRYFTVGGAAIGTLIAILGMYDWLLPWLMILGKYIPPIGGVIAADFVARKGIYPPLNEVKEKFNWAGIAGYIAGVLTAEFTPGVPPLNGVIISFLVYIAFKKFNTSLSGRRGRL